MGGAVADLCTQASLFHAAFTKRGLIFKGEERRTISGLLDRMVTELRQPRMGKGDTIRNDNWEGTHLEKGKSGKEKKGGKGQETLERSCRVNQKERVSRR